MNMNDLRILQLDEWVIKLREPDSGDFNQVILLLHGWTGDENSMWVFAPQLPRDALLIAPRAPYPSSHNEAAGYSWRGPKKTGDWSSLDDYRPAVKELNRLVLSIQNVHGFDLSKFGMVGFSQGAAVAYVYAILNPERITRVAGLAGFIPDHTAREIEHRPLEGKAVFVAHGKKDVMVPLERAKKSVEALQNAGGLVTYCEADVGHKLGANCFRELKTFFSSAQSGN
ncbi:MAG: alpha/beta fold hydrolase [Chloroflexi bacterium]|nr:alpha/beta fold hydrolase [Chloroflexota bacterium]